MIRQNMIFGNGEATFLERVESDSLRFPRHVAIAAILLVALLAFEVFNFDTTRYALENLLGPVTFAGLGWATVLAIAFCAIDFAGLVRLFTPDDAGEQPREVWYLMGAWLLGATMNAVMTWWAVSLTLLNHDFGNEVLTRAQLLRYVPVFVAVLVWLTRILFIGALTITGGHILGFAANENRVASARKLSPPTGRPLRERGARGIASNGVHTFGAQKTVVSPVHYPHTSSELPPFLKKSRNRAREEAAQTTTAAAAHPDGTVKGAARTDEPGDLPTRSTKYDNGRVRQRPPMPGVRKSGANGPARNGN